MEISVGNPGGSETKSLDLKTVYTSEVSNTGGSVKKGKSCWLDNDEGTETKKRNSRDEVAVTSFEDVTPRKKVKHNLDDTEVDTLSSGLGQIINGSSRSNAIGMDTGGDDGALIPKWPHGPVGWSKFAKSPLLKPSAASGFVGEVVSLKDGLLQSRGGPMDCKTSSAEQVVNLNGKSGVKASTKQKGVVGFKSNQQQESEAVASSCHAKNNGDDLDKPTFGSKDEVAKVNQEIKKISQEEVLVADAPLDCSSIEEIPQSKVVGAKAPVSSTSTSADQMDKLNGNSNGKLRNNVKKKGTDVLVGNQDQKEDTTVIDSSHIEKAETIDFGVNNKDPFSKRNSSSRRKRKMAGLGSETVAKTAESSVEKKVGICYLDPDDDLEQNAARMLSSRFDPSFTGFASKYRTSALSSANGDFFSEKPIANAGSEGPMAVSDPACADAADRVLRSRRQQKSKGTSRKRRHFYEIHSDDLDAHWFLNRKIKIFWPLDECWYYGVVHAYDAVKNLHHIKYDDRDEEWVSLQNERFKLLLLPSEVVARKPIHIDTAAECTHNEGNDEDGRSRAFQMRDEGFMASHMESEPIISWLARSSHRVKSSPSTLKKQNLSHFPSEPLLLSDNSTDVYKNRSTSLLVNECGQQNCSSAFRNTSSDRRKNQKSVLEKTDIREGSLPIVYVRRRYCKVSDAADVPFVNSFDQGFHFSAEGSGVLARLGSGELHWSLNSVAALKLDASLIESKKFEMCISLWPMLTYVLGANILWLLHNVLLLQYGTMVTMCPTVFLEVLFVDNVVGLRLFLFEGCLTQAVTLIFLVMKVFCESNKDELVNQWVPVTSIRFKLSFFQNFRKHKVFAYYSFSKARDSQWQYLDSVLQRHCILAKHLTLPECTYDNVKLLEAGTPHTLMPYAGQTTYFEVSQKKSSPGAVLFLDGSRSSYPVHLSQPTSIYSFKNGNLPQFALSFSAAPHLFMSLHLKLLLEHSIAALGAKVRDPIHSFLPPDDNCSHIEDQFEITSECSSKSHEAMSSFDDDVIVTIDGRPRNSSQLVFDASLNVDVTSLSSKAAEIVPVENGNLVKYEGVNQQPQQSGVMCSSNLNSVSVEIPSSDAVYRDCRKTSGVQQVSDLTWNLSDGIICSPNPTGPRSLWHRNKSGSSSSFFGDSLHAWTDGKMDFSGNGFGNGPKKPRTQVQYTMPSRELIVKNKGHNRIGLPYQRIRKANEKKSLDASKGPRGNLELVSCDANILINGGDKGWRECGACVFLENADQNEWKLAVKCGGMLKYSYKVHQDLQPGSTNRYTHAMMWKGGKDWALEFPDRSQWFIFKEMHEECHNRNIRAASIKNIPIPGVRLIEDSVADQEETPFVHSPWYFRQVRNDVEMAMDALHVVYDMDSEDEEWISRNMASGQSPGSEEDMISDELFEKVMDMLEKVSYAQKRDHFTSGEIEELIARVSPIQTAKSIYEHWREKRQQKGMALIRQLQPPLWERYQQICREWDQSKPKFLTGLVTGSQDKASADDKPPMFAFCLKPRGLELLNKGSKHRPHKKISLSGHAHASLGDHDAHRSSRRKVSTHGFGDECSDMLSKMYSPRDGGGVGHSEWNNQLRIQRNNSNTITTLVSPKMGVASSSRKRNNRKKLNNQPSSYWHPSQLVLGGSDLDEFRLRDASSAAKHARNMAKLKRERAQKLMLAADLAIHKAISALMTAEAIKACTQDDPTNLTPSSTS